MRQQIGQQLIIGLETTKLTQTEAEFIIANNIGGVILMKRNVESPQQVRELCLSLQSLRNRMPDKASLFISVDMEGGRVARMKAPFTQWPALAKIGALDSTSVAFQFAHAMGAELRAVGVNLDFAPCIDVLTNPLNTVIGDRALSESFDKVGKLGSAIARGYIKSGIIPCAKHFPGHGNTLLDSHEALPVENKTLNELESCELEPFKKVFKARLDFVMAAHIKYPQIDPEWPASLSEIFLKKILREQLRYRGLVITDDLDMKALTLNFNKGEIAVQALKAGANILLYCNEPESPRIALDAIEKALQTAELDSEMITENHRRILEIKANSLLQPEPLSLDEIKSIVGHPDYLRLSKGIETGLVPADLLTQST